MNLKTWQILQTGKDSQSISDCVIKVSDCLNDFGVAKKSVTMFSLYLEELLVYITGDEFITNDKINVVLRKSLNDVSIRIYLKGQKVPLDDRLKVNSSSARDYLEMNDSELENSISSKLLSAGMENISYRYKNNTNIYHIDIKSSQNDTLVKVLGSMAAGMLFGFLMKKFLPEDVTAYISDNIFTAVTTMFLSAVKMVVGPMIFCSLACCISSYTDLSVLRKIGRHTLLHYLSNAVIGIILAVVICCLFNPGVNVVSSAVSGLDVSSVSSDNVEVSNIWETIANIIPSNIFAAFHSSEIIQIIFFAMVFGIAMGRNEETCKYIRSNINAIEKVFKVITSYVMRFLPIMVFCSMANMSVSIGIDTVFLILYWLLLIFLAYIVMIFIYSLMVCVKRKENPITYIKKVLPTLLVAFSMGSSSASMSNTMDACDKQLNIKPEIYTFSIPLGTSIHCCSSCIFYIISVVFLNNIYTGANSLPNLDILFYFSAFMLAFGAPSVSGAGPICVSMLLSSIGAPMELVALIIAWDPIVSTIKTSCSCMEDLSVAYMVDKELEGEQLA